MRVAPPELHQARHRRVREDLLAAGLDGLLVTSLPNLAYLTGLFATSASLVISAEHLHLIVDGRYVEAARARSQNLPAVSVVTIPPDGSQMESLAAVLDRCGHRRVGVEASHLSIRQHTDLLARVPRDTELVPTNDVIELRRAIKDSWELQVLREAGRRLSDAAKCIIPKALAGLSERQLAAAAEGELRQVGFDKPAFDTIVASGANSAMPHHRAGSRRLETGDLVIVDFGGLLDGYAVDMTRTVTVGLPTKRQRQVLEQVAAAQSAAFEAVQAGRRTTDVDAAARGVLERAGLGEAFTHGTGHGLGLEVHERPRVMRHRADLPAEILQAGMVFTLEPGAYLPGWGGVRIEDDVTITATGAQWLTGGSKA